jgi:hypothetical protein
VQACPRCGDFVCELHRQSKHAWCARCEEEWQDEVDFARAEATLWSPGFIDTSEPNVGNAGAFNLVLLAYTVVSGPFRRRSAVKRAEREFIARDRVAIDEWRTHHPMGAVEGAS